ncbi:MAG: hypothetical protein HQ481_07485 [Alphaproteobacteria bacterium]|nr:hypothetical protein [Alphaproteobacteria bacterium]
MRRLTLLLAAGLVACAPTVHVPYDDPGADQSQAGRRTVAHETRPMFWQRPPRCVVVLPIARANELDALDARAIEAAAARHLSGRVDRVLGPMRRDRALRRLALSLDHPDDRRRFAAQTDCGHGVRLATEVRGGWALIWTERQIGFAADLIDLRDDTVLWQARHTARRGGGGVPLSPLSLLMSAGVAAQLATDEDVLPSLLDDALRRTLATLPDTR